MTRGRMAIIYDDGSLATSIEFNGDMGPNDLGKEVVEKLSRVHNDTDFCVAVVNFDAAHFQYNYSSMITAVTGDWYNTAYDYSNKWSSDYVYIKNLSKDTKYFVTPDGFIGLPPEEILTLRFGKLIKPKLDKFANINVGDIVTLADIEWIVLEKTDNSAFCLTKDIIEVMRYSEFSQFYPLSNVYSYLQKFFTKIKNKVGEDSFVSRTIELNTSNPYNMYGSTKEIIGLLTEPEYQKFKPIIKKHFVDKWWWLATVSQYDGIRCVNKYNALANALVRNCGGVRPACIFKAEVFEKG